MGSDDPVDPNLSGALSGNGGPTLNDLLLPGSLAIDESNVRGLDHRGRFPIGFSDLGAVEAEWGATLDRTDFVGGPALDFMTVGAHLTITDGTIGSSSSAELANDNDASTQARFLGSRNVILTTDLASGSFRPRGIRIIDPDDNVEALLLYGSENGSKFELLGSADVAGATGDGAGQKDFFLRPSSSTAHLEFRKPYRQFRAQFIPTDFFSQYAGA